MDPKALSKLCNSGGELPQLPNSCQQHSATGTEQERKGTVSMGLPAAFRFVERNSPKWNLAQTGSHLRLVEAQQKCILIPKWSNRFPFLQKNTCEWNQYQSFAWENQLYYIFQITFLILEMTSLRVDQDMVGSGGTSFLFHTSKRSINNCGIELNQAVWNLMCSNPLFFHLSLDFLRGHFCNPIKS